MESALVAALTEHGRYARFDQAATWINTLDQSLNFGIVLARVRVAANSYLISSPHLSYAWRSS